MFKDYVLHTKEIELLCFQNDFKLIRFPKKIKDKSELEKVRAILAKNYDKIIEAYKFYASYAPIMSNGYSVWCVNYEDFQHFCNKCNLRMSSQIKEHDIEKIFADSSRNADKTNPLSGAGMVRYQFIEGIIWLA